MPQEKPLHAILGPLNEPQRTVATHGDSPLLVIAGAGSGKTTALVHRVAYRISQGVNPERILLLTFTRRAAGEMLRRVQRVLSTSNDSRRVWGGTFHGTGARLLRTYGNRIGMNPRFTIHDRGDSEDLMKTLVGELDLSKKDKKFPKKGTCVAIHSYRVNSGRSLTAVLGSHFRSSISYAQPLSQLFAAYQQRKQDLAVLDYDDLLLKWLELLEHEEAGPSIRARFDCVLVDEYQDTNTLQANMLKRLCPDGKGLTVVGDDAQSIYSFRAATVRNILDFPKQFPGTTVVKLEQNYRSTQPLLEGSNRLISEASEKYAKKLWSARDEGVRPQLISCRDQNEQTDFVIQQILHHHQCGIPFRNQAVLFRASHHSITLEAELARHEIQYVKYGGLKFAEAAHVKDVLSFLRLAENHRDVVAGVRLLTLLPGVGATTASRWIQRLAEHEGCFQAWAQAKPPSKAAEIWPRLVRLMQQLQTDPPGNMADQIRRVLEFYRPILEEKYDNADRRFSDLEQLEQIAARFTERGTMLADLAIDPPSSEADLPGTPADNDYLVLSTMHSAKGLEWNTVYVLHASDGMLPSQHTFHDAEQLEEERRMFYVALTRAADCLYVCHCQYHRLSRGWEDWEDDGLRELSRFMSGHVCGAFQSQRAAKFQFQSPHLGVKSPKSAGKKKARRPTRRKSTG